MIIDIDIKQLGSIVMELNKLINEYEEVELNIFNQLKNSCVNWQDGNSKIFERKTKHEKEETNAFLLSLQNNQALFKMIFDEYKILGNKIHINYGKKKLILELIDICLSYINSAQNELNKMEKGFYYRELDLIKKQNERITNIRNSLLEMKSKINELFNKIKSIEERILLKISKIEDLKINEFDFMSK